MLCLNFLIRGRCPLGTPLLPERPKSTIRNEWGKFCSIVPKNLTIFFQRKLPMHFLQTDGPFIFLTTKDMVDAIFSDLFQKLSKVAIGRCRWRIQLSFDPSKKIATVEAIVKRFRTLGCNGEGRLCQIRSSKLDSFIMQIFILILNSG